MKKAVMYGGGNIGRGFIAQLFCLSGYETIFIDVMEPLVNAINEKHTYPIYITGENGYDQFNVTNVRAVNGRDNDAIAAEIATADVMATAVGVNILKFIAGPIAGGIARRHAEGAKPLDIIICENKIDADAYLRSLIDEKLPEADKEYFATKIGLVEASIGRMVPATPDDIKAKEPLAVCVEPFGILPVNRDAMVTDLSDFVNLQPDSPFEMYIQRKLFMHNMSHAVTAYLGSLKGYTYIWEAIADPEIRYVALAALTESAAALSKEHHVDIIPLLAHAYDLLSRFDNKLLGDTIARVGKDTQRKLGENDRIVGALNLCRKNGLPCDFIAIGLAAGLLFAPEGDDSSIELNAFVKSDGIAAALKKYSNIQDEDLIALTERRVTELTVAKKLTLKAI